MPKVSSKELIDELIDIYASLLVPFMQVKRDMPFPTEPTRQETDTEHAFTLAILAPTIARRLGFALNEDLIIKYAVVHDLVEAYAGDVSVRHASYHDKAAQEEAAFQQIQQRFVLSAPWIAETIHQYEQRQDPESRFVYVADKLMGALTRLVDNGASWAEYYPEVDGSGYHAVVKRLRKKAEAYPDLLEFFDDLHDHLDGEWPKYLEPQQSKEPVKAE